MILRPHPLFALLLTASLLAPLACGDDDNNGVSSVSSGAGGMGGTGGLGGAGGMGGSPLDCGQRCDGLFDCGLQADGGVGGAGGGGEPPQLCNGFSEGGAGGAGGGGPGGLTKAAFVGDSRGGCIQQCEGSEAFAKLIDPSDCAGTIATLKVVNGAFKVACNGN